MQLWKGNIGVMVDVDTSSECLVVLIHRMFDFLPSRFQSELPPFFPPPSSLVTTVANVHHHMADTGACCLGLPILPTHAGAQYIRASTVATLLRCQCAVREKVGGVEGFKSSGELERNI